MGTRSAEPQPASDSALPGEPSRGVLQARIAELERELARLRDIESDARDRLTTVKVPEALEPLFLRAQDYVARYFSERIENPDAATISIAGERYVLLRAASLSVEFVEMVMKLYQDKGTEEARSVADNLLFDFAHAIGKADARSFQQKMAVSDPMANLSAGPIHFAFSGLASVDISAQSRPSPDEDYFLLYDHPFSFESHSWLAKGKRSDSPVCSMSAGYSSGWCEESFGMPLVAAEVECIASGGEHCRFIMAPPSRIEAHMRDYALQHGARAGSAPDSRPGIVPEFFQRKRLEDELRDANEQLELRVQKRTLDLERASEQLHLLGSAVENATEGFVVMQHGMAADPLKILFVNHGFSRITGHSAGEMVGASLARLQLSEGDADAFDSLVESMRRNEPWQAEVTARRPDASTYALEIHAMPVPDKSGAPSHWVAILRDASDRKAHLEALRHQALHDALTGLPNRVLLNDRIEQAIVDMRHRGTQFALLFLDLDGFKEINDTLGHKQGDKVLLEVATRLRTQLRGIDTLARMGGDEFMIVLPSTSGAEAVAQMARGCLDALRLPIRLDGYDLFVGASIGISLFPDDADNVEDLQRQADIAMYMAKQDGRNTYHFYSPTVSTHLAEALDLRGQLHRALELGQFELHYQPQYTQSGRLRGLEALLRWNHPELGLVLPDKFIPIAEVTGLIIPIGEWVLAEACRQMAAWQGAGLEGALVCVNVSIIQFERSTWVDTVRRALVDSGIDPSRLELELTESVLMRDVRAAAVHIEKLHELGVRVAIDDFGVGYSSLNLLHELPVDALKIDQSFIRGIDRPNGDANTAVVRSIVRMGKELGLELVAEGVETTVQASFLRQLDCDAMQGYLFGGAMTRDMCRDYLGLLERPSAA